MNTAVVASALCVAKNFTCVEQIFVSGSENSRLQVSGTAIIAAGHIMIQGDQLQLQSLYITSNKIGTTEVLQIPYLELPQIDYTEDQIKKIKYLVNNNDTSENYEMIKDEITYWPGTLRVEEQIILTTDYIQASTIIANGMFNVISDAFLINVSTMLMLMDPPIEQYFNIYFYHPTEFQYKESYLKLMKRSVMVQDLMVFNT